MAAMLGDTAKQAGGSLRRPFGKWKRSETNRREGRLCAMAIAVLMLAVTGCDRAQYRGAPGDGPSLTAVDPDSNQAAAPHAELTFNDLPEAVQRTVNARIPGSRITDIDREESAGLVVYELEYVTNGTARELYVRADGALLSRADVNAPFGQPGAGEAAREEGDERHLRFGDLPSPVREILEQRGVVTNIIDIDSFTWRGKQVFEIEFVEQEQRREVFVDQDGRLLNRETAGRVK